MSRPISPKSLAIMGLKLAILEHRPMIREEALGLFKTLVMMTEVEDLQQTDELIAFNEQLLDEFLEESQPECLLYATQMLMFHFSRLGYWGSEPPLTLKYPD